MLPKAYFNQDKTPMIVVGYFNPPRGPHGLRIATAFFDLRPIPAYIVERVPKGRCDNMMQVLINTFGSYMWINIEKSWEIRSRSGEAWKEALLEKTGFRDPNPADNCMI